MSINELAQRANVSRANAYTRVDRLRTDGVIRGIGAWVDGEKLGLDVSALILVNVDQGDWRRIRDELLHLPGLDYLAVTSGEFDFVLLIRVADMHTLRDVVLGQVHDIRGVRATRTAFVLDEHAFLATGPFGG